MRAARDEPSLFKPVDHRGGRARRKTSQLGKFGRARRALEGHNVKTLHVRGIYAELLAHGLMEENRADAVLPSAEDDLLNQPAFTGFGHA
jgi:hypothetical protein